jgi:enolase
VGLKVIGKYEITKVHARQVLDSRGSPTVECDIVSGKGFGRAQVPSGASTGKHEAFELRDGGRAWRGRGVLNAVRNVNDVIAPKLIDHDVRDQDGIDRMMLELDGTPDKSGLGANAILSVSIAAAKCAAFAKEAPLHEHIAGAYAPGRETYVIPVPFFNVINGGAHSGSGLSIQEFMIVPKAKTFSSALEMGCDVYRELREVIAKKHGASATGVGDEGGFAPPAKNTEEALKLLEAAAQKAGHAQDVFFSLDVAASQLGRKGSYTIDKKRMSNAALVKFYSKLVKDFDIVNIEDPFHEDDFAGFAELTQALPKVQITGDDVFVTSTQRLKEGIRLRAGNAMLLKVNQAGSVSEALQAAHFAANSNYRVMVSHRSGDTCDSFIASLAVGIAAKEIKAGSPARSERTEKYNELLRAEELGITYAQWID